MNNYIYLIVELDNLFLNLLVKYFKEVGEELSPEGKCHLEAKISSDFSKVLIPNFDPLSQKIDFNVQLEAGGSTITKLK